MAQTLKHGLKWKLLATAIIPAVGLWAADSARAADDALLVAQAATGTQQQPGAGARGAATQERASRDARASQLIGMDVRNAQGENLGQVNDLIIDINGQTVHYAVLGFGGFLGLGERLFAYPVQAFRFGPDRDELVLNVERERLRQAPGFERNRWPDWGRRDDPYRTEVDRFHARAGEQPGAVAGQRLARASEMIGQNVDDQRSDRAGEIEDLVVNLDTGRVRYAVLELAGDWGMGDKLVPLPLQSFLFPAESGRNPVLNVPRERLDTSLAFESGQWPNINDPSYRRNLDRSLGGAPRGVAGRPGADEARERDQQREERREERRERDETRQR